MLDFSIYIRPLTLEDAAVSYKWRNNPKIWRFTGSRPNVLVTPEIEREWLAQVLQRKDEKRFAICLKTTHEYIGNVYLTDIKDGTAFIHIFIGDIENWGRKRAFEAIVLLGIHGFNELNLHTICGVVDKRNIASNALAGFLSSCQVEEFVDEASQRSMVKWIFTKEMYQQNIHFFSLQKKKDLQKEK